MHTRAATTVMLGIAQTLAWASSYYLPAVLANSMARDLNTPPSTVFGAFSLALLVSAAVGPYAGRVIDRAGGRPVLVVSNLVFAAALAALSQANHIAWVFAAWALMGVAMGSGLYEAAFSTVVRLYGQDARRAITDITLFAGFASTVGWPLSTWLEGEAGWRSACLVWAGLHLLIGLPLNLLLPRTPIQTAPSSNKASPTGQAKEVSSPDVDPPRQRQAAMLMAYVFAVTWFTSTSMAAHLPVLLQAAGASLGAAIAIAALVGPAQVTGRVVEFTLLNGVHPLRTARLATLAHPLGALCLVVLGSAAAGPFAVLHGLGNGILTIAIGTLPLLVFGAQGYGQRQGLLMVPARVVQAGAPYLFGVAMGHWGTAALGVSGALGLSAWLSLTVMSRRRRSKAPP